MEEETPLGKAQTKIEIKAQGHELPPPPLPFSSFETNQPEVKFPFFKTRYRQRASDTWLISLFVVLHLLAFIITIIFNHVSLGSGAFFQPLSENPLLGPSASTLDKVGALRREFLTKNRQTWRLFACPWLHAGVIHFAINISCMIFVGIHLERDHGPLRIGIIYLLSAYFGSLVCSLFVHNDPVVASSGALFGLLGTMFSGLIQNWKIYTNKYVALAVVLIIFGINFLLGLLPYIDNFANIGAFISGLLLGFVFLITPRMKQMSKKKAGLYIVEGSINLKQNLKLDRPILRSVSLLLFIILLVGCLLAAFRGIDVNHYCGWCRSIDCIHSRWWRCDDSTNACEILKSDSDLTLTCLRNGKYKVFHDTNMSQSRITDLCAMIC